MGGRIFTQKHGDLTFDLGASWLHETLNNSLFNMAVKNHIQLECDDGVFEFYTKDGVVPASLKIHRVAAEILAQIELNYAEGSTVPDMPLKDYAVKFLQTRPLVSERDKTLAARYIQFIKHWLGLSWEDQSAAMSQTPRVGRDAYVLKGMAQVFDLVLRDVLWEKVQLVKSTSVVSVEKASSGCKVSTNDGRIFHSEHIICTVSAGVFARFNASLFPLELPKELRAAMESNTMAALGKVYLRFSEVFWDESLDRVEIMVNDDLNSETGLKPGKFPVFFTNVFKYMDAPVLVGLIAPPLTQYLEANPDRAFEFLKPALSAISTQEQGRVLDPLEVVVTGWTRNSHFLGSYSGFRAGESVSRIEAYIRGAGTLRFAGEHTVIEGAGCAHGAYESGMREARVVLDLIAEKSNHRLMHADN